MRWEFPMDFPKCERPFRPGGSKEVAFLVWTPNPNFQLRLREVHRCALCCTEVDKQTVRNVTQMMALKRMDATACRHWRSLETGDLFDLSSLILIYFDEYES